MTNSRFNHLMEKIVFEHSYQSVEKLILEGLVSYQEKIMKNNILHFCLQNFSILMKEEYILEKLEFYLIVIPKFLKIDNTLSKTKNKDGYIPLELMIKRPLLSGELENLYLRCAKLVLVQKNLETFFTRSTQSKTKGRTEGTELCYHFTTSHP